LRAKMRELRRSAADASSIMLFGRCDIEARRSTERSISFGLLLLGDEERNILLMSFGLLLGMLGDEERNMLLGLLLFIKSLLFGLLLFPSGDPVNWLAALPGDATNRLRLPGDADAAKYRLAGPWLELDVIIILNCEAECIL
jgi:hypothetical protein